MISTGKAMHLARLARGRERKGDRERARERYIYIYAVELKTGPRFGVL